MKAENLSHPRLSLVAMPAQPKHFKIGVCLYPECTMLDFDGAIELLSPLELQARAKSAFSGDVPVTTEVFYLAHTLEPVKPFAGPRLVPDKTYDDPSLDELNVILVPGGTVADNVPQALNDFLIRRVPTLQYVLTVCTGSWLLANTGLLDGKRATSNKFTFKRMLEATKDHPIEWVAKARWVVDGNIWSSSGVTAGMDMANAWLEHIAGKELAAKLRGVIELSARGEGDDEFAEMFGLV
ncbi:class I glutamine amidotransferase-like protein [Mycena capillaripes]|nr:class I glutamine amidotransferase-like protein [Mycena capillaripes]